MNRVSRDPLSESPVFLCKKLLMEFRIWVEVRLAGRILHRQLVAQVEREATGIGPEEIGLTLEEGKTVLSQVQAGGYCQLKLFGTSLD